MTSHQITPDRYYDVTPLGGTMWTVYLVNADEDGEPVREHVGLIDAGKIDDDGQWQGDEEDVLAAGLAGNFPLLDDVTPVRVDGVWVRR